MSTSVCLEFPPGFRSIRELTDIPVMDFGAPVPIVLADEHTLVLGYYTHNDQWAMLKFRRCYAYSVGLPNEEAIEGHPLHEFGLDRGRAYEIEKSPWIHLLEVANRVHTHHDPSFFDKFRHFIISFHDSTFECVAQTYTSLQTDAETTAQTIIALHEFFTQR